MTDQPRQRMADLLSAMRATPEGYFTSRWGQPEYTDWLDESLSWKETCYIGDWSFLWERRCGRWSTEAASAPTS